MGHDHDHTHEPFDSPGIFADRESLNSHRDFADRAFTVGIGGPVGSGKTALLQALCERLRDEYSLGVVTNDIFTREDAEFLLRHEALEQERIVGVETGGCPHAAIREDISLNLNALEDLMDRFAGVSTYCWSKAAATTWRLISAASSSIIRCTSSTCLAATKFRARGDRGRPSRICW